MYYISGTVFDLLFFQIKDWNKTFFYRRFSMRRIAMLLLAGMTIVAAQTGVDSMMQQKKMDALNQKRGLDTIEMQNKIADHLKGFIDTAKQNKIDQTRPIDTAKCQNKSKINMKDSAESMRDLQEKLHAAIDTARAAADSAHHAAIQFRKELHGKTIADSTKLLDQRKAQIQERLRNAIAALDKASAKVNAQIDQAQARIQTRLQQKKAELILIQERLNAKKDSKTGSTTSK